MYVCSLQCMYVARHCNRGQTSPALAPLSEYTRRQTTLKMNEKVFPWHPPKLSFIYMYTGCLAGCQVRRHKNGPFSKSQYYYSALKKLCALRTRSHRRCSSPCDKKGPFSKSQYYYSGLKKNCALSVRDHTGVVLRLPIQFFAVRSRSPSRAFCLCYFS